MKTGAVELCVSGSDWHGRASGRERYYLAALYTNEVKDIVYVAETDRGLRTEYHAH